MKDDFLKKMLLLIVDVVLVYLIFVGLELLPEQFNEQLKFVILIVLIAFMAIPSLAYWLDIKW